MNTSIDQEFAVITELVRAHARSAPQRPALVHGDSVLDYAALDAQMDRVAWALQRDGLVPGDSIASWAGMSVP